MVSKIVEAPEGVSAQRNTKGIAKPIPTPNSVLAARLQLQP